MHQRIKNEGIVRAGGKSETVFHESSTINFQQQIDLCSV